MNGNIPILGQKPKPPSDAAIRNALAQMANGIDKVFNPGLPGVPTTRTVGFILMAFPFGPSVIHQTHRVNAISNASHEDMIKILEEQIQVLKNAVAAQAAPPESATEGG